jgi:hypothetical protein
VTSVSAREPLPQPDANHADQNWHPRGGRIFIRDNHLYGAAVASINGVDDGPGDESKLDVDSQADMPVVVLVILWTTKELAKLAPIPQTTNLWRFHRWMLQCVTTVMVHSVDPECSLCFMTGSQEDHALTFPEPAFRIPLSLWESFIFPNNQANQRRSC